MSVGPDLKQSILDLNLQLLSSSEISFLLLGRYLNIRFECILIPSWDSITYLLNQPPTFREHPLLTSPDSWYFGWSISRWCPPTVSSSAPPPPQAPPSVERFAAPFSEEMDRYCLASLMNIAWHHWWILLGIWRFWCGNEVKWSRTQCLKNCLMWALCQRQRRKKLGSRVALLPGKFLHVRKVFVRTTEKTF